MTPLSDSHQKAFHNATRFSKTRHERPAIIPAFITEDHVRGIQDDSKAAFRLPLTINNPRSPTPSMKISNLSNRQRPELMNQKSPGLLSVEHQRNFQTSKFLRRAEQRSPRPPLTQMLVEMYSPPISISLNRGILKLFNHKKDRRSR